MTAREVMRLIERNGGILLRQRGSHRQYEAQRDLEPVFGKGWLKRR